jgi:hypothetical protein
MARGLDAGKYFWRSGREKCFSLDIPSPRTWLRTPVESTNRSRQVLGTSDSAQGTVNCFYRTFPQPRRLLVNF